MDIPQAWMERLFARLQAIYGNKMAVTWGDVPAADVMDAWRTGMEGLTAEQIGAGLKACPTAYPEWPPTLGQFIAICKPAPVPLAHRPLLPSPKPFRSEIDAAQIAQDLAVTFLEKSRKDPKHWARDILARHEKGERFLPIQIEFAREALS